MSFEELGVPTALVKVLADAGIATPFPIQAATIADALAGRDVCGRAPTGSGKTLAFGVPVVAGVARARPRHPAALVLVPTRELADQVADELRPLARARKRSVHAFYGGVGFHPQLRALQRGVDLAVACPGRLADLVNQGEVHLDQVRLVVVDEADRMADMGFLPEVRRLLDRTRDDRQTLLFSATLDGDVDVLIRRYQHDPARHEVHDPDEGKVRGTHHLWNISREERVAVCADVVAAAGPTVVFVRTRHGADRLTRQLAKAGIDGVPIHGNRSQAQRTRALDAFATGRAQALVATDVAARGIHVDDVACVVHYDLPADAKDYVHRSGRTARAGAEGVVVALVLPGQHKDADALARTLDLGVSPAPPDVQDAFGRVGQRQPRTPATPNRSPLDRTASDHGTSDRPTKDRPSDRRSSVQRPFQPETGTPGEEERSERGGTRNGRAGNRHSNSRHSSSGSSATVPDQRTAGSRRDRARRRDDQPSRSDAARDADRDTGRSPQGERTARESNRTRRGARRPGTTDSTSRGRRTAGARDDEPSRGSKRSRGTAGPRPRSGAQKRGPKPSGRSPRPARGTADRAQRPSRPGRSGGPARTTRQTRNGPRPKRSR